MKNISKLYQNYIKKPLQNLSKIDPKTSPKTSPKPIQKPIQNLSKNLSYLEAIRQPRIIRNRYIYIYIYSILGQPGLTLEREARLMGEIILR